jgi:hypothetical protein
MGRLLRIVVVLILSVVAVGSSVAQGKKAHAAHEQTKFVEGDRPQHAVQLSAEVLNILLETKEVKQELTFVSDSERKNAAQLFQASEVHLNGPDEVDLIVIGIPPMAGADSGWFWIVRSANKNPQMVLFAGGNTLELMDSKTLGYRDIRGVSSTASETRDAIYHFDGDQYKLWKEKRTQNRDN